MRKAKFIRKIIIIAFLTVFTAIIIFFVKLAESAQENSRIQSNFEKARKTYTALMKYAQKYDGNFPKELSLLVEEKLLEKDDLFYYADTKGFSEKLEPWVYYYPLNTSSRTNTIIFHSTSPIKSSHVAIKLDGSIEISSEQDFQKEVEKTKLYIAERLRED